MEEKEFVCIRCPLGCNISVKLEQGKITEITGNTCKRGEEYVTKELTNPTRIVTSLVRVKGGEMPVVSVKTEEDIPKDKIFDCMKEIKNAAVQAPVNIGDVIIDDICGTGVRIVATRNVRVR